ncbi:polyphenol oxidase family protein [Aeromicrobium terrae]|uniref:polyphenol oxidase family protein n=1 Tax=Aeromicrobium terrae TaxID=2498846 RepID=UPI001E4FAF8D|nr:polyphenol oxidase family protein [Aeromicrobium terrae]
MFFWRGTSGPIELGFTDRSLDLSTAAIDGSRDQLARAAGVETVATMHQVHGADVAWVDAAGGHPDADALVTGTPGLGLLVRVADCVPIVLAAPDDGLVGVVHSGRNGLVAGVVPAAVDALRSRGATSLEAWVGPHICGLCYELPAEMAEDVADHMPEARSTTRQGTPAADLGAGVQSQLEQRDVVVHRVDVCTLEDERFFSHRRGDTGRFGAVAVIR